MMKIMFSEETFTVQHEGISVTVPIAEYPRLLRATPEQRAKWGIAGAGRGIHWPEIDEDLSFDRLFGR
jgi:hypothetical protein